MQKNRRGPRQGDVLFRPVDRVRGERVQPMGRKHILVLGEQTGHHHWVSASPNVAVFLARDGQFVDGETKVQHQEHDSSALSGTYEIVQQRRVVNHLTLRASD